MHSDWRMRMSKNSDICKEADIQQSGSEETESHQELVLGISVCPAAVSEA